MIRFYKKEVRGAINYKTDWMEACCEAIKDAFQTGALWLTSEDCVQIRQSINEVCFCPYCGELVEIKIEEIEEKL